MVRRVPRKLLVVDDDPSVNRMLARYLSLAGFDVATECDPRLAMDRLKLENFRVVILDIDMPGKSGTELLEDIKRYDGSIPVIMISGKASLSNLTRAYQAGAEFIALKPLTDLTEFREVINRSFERLDHWATMIDYVRTGLVVDRV